MKYKKHKKEEINFCQSGRHRMPYCFSNGETCYLIEFQTMEKYETRIIVCVDCKKMIKERPLEKILLEA